MSTTETWEISYKCPCGKGRIAQESSCGDHAFARTYHSFSLDCPECQKHWRIDHYHGHMIHDSDEAAVKAASEVLYPVQTRVHSLIDARAMELAKEAEPHPPKSMAAELRLLQGRYHAKGWSYSTYISTRKKTTFYSMLSDQLRGQAKAAVPADLAATYEAAQAAYNATYRGMLDRRMAFNHWGEVTATAPLA